MNLIVIACKRELDAEDDCTVTGTSVNRFLVCDAPKLLGSIG